MLKPFNELIKLDLTEHIEQKPNFVWDKKEGKYKEKGSFDYLNWAKAIVLLYEHGAEFVNYKPLKNETGHSLFMNPSLLADGLDGCPEVRVWVKVDDKEGEFSYPLARGSSVVKKEKMTALDIHVCQQRALVKGIAILTGLGLYLWTKEEPPGDHEAEEIEQIKNKKINKIQLDALKAEFQRTKVKEKQIIDLYNVEKLTDLNFVQWREIMTRFEQTPTKKDVDLGL
jgi:hypothetical protein